mmetsp:Transcript_11079/g.27630  ORF Transcript_11079/g.27630 Transcript_11079/m.27630 type:complete len:777 (-) Transcript_11079:645-2975(-)
MASTGGNCSGGGADGSAADSGSAGNRIDGDHYINVLSTDEVAAFECRTHVAEACGDSAFLIDWAAAARDVLQHPRVRAVVEAETAADPKQASHVHDRAAAMARELCAAISQRFLAATSMVASTMFKRLYAGIVFENGQLRSLAELCAKAHAEGRSIVFLPSHKSHIDYIVLQFAFHTLGLGTPAIAAGDNLNLPCVGEILRRNGAFFIRRTFSGPDSALYSAIVAAYLEGLLRRGANIKFFPEGGRSRSGKLLQPKVGMLGMALEPVLSGAVEDFYIVPISIYYDKVMETRTYASELLGAKKPKESLIGLVGQAQHLLAMPRTRYGNIHVRVAPGFSAKGYLERQVQLQRASGARPNFDPRASAADLVVLLKGLAYHVLEEINRVSSVTPTALVGTALLCTMARGTGRADLIRKVDWLREKVVRSGGHMSRFFDFPGECTTEVVDSALAVLGSLVRVVDGLVEPIYVVAPGKHFELSYYRNMCVHVFIHQSIIAVALHRFLQQHPDARWVGREAVMHDVRFLSRLLKYEYVFSGAAGQPWPPLPERIVQSSQPSLQQQPDVLPARVSEEVSSEWGNEFLNTALMRNFDAALELMAADGVVEIGDARSDIVGLEQMHHAKRKGNYEMWNTHFTFLCALVWPVIESYWLVLAGLHFLFQHGVGSIEEARAKSCLQAFAKTLVSLGHVHYDEAASEEPLRKALQTYSEMGIVQRVPATDEEGKRSVMLKLGPNHVGDGSAQLARLVAEVASYRCRFHEQEGMEDYPKYIAFLAFGLAKL